MIHRAGYVSILGKPNAGKSTLLNALLGQKLSIVSHKVQTTRHRILGIKNEDDVQIVFSDTPGIIEPAYPLQKAMMKAVESSLIDADALLIVSAMDEALWEDDLNSRIASLNIPRVVALNKVDLADETQVQTRMTELEQTLHPAHVIPISATKGFNIESVLYAVREHLPEHPPYFDKEDLSDRNIRFFVSELIREKILNRYQKEIPYSVEVLVTEYREGKDLDKIFAEIIVERESQKVILLGTGGEMMKKMATDARLDIEKFTGKKVFIEMRIKVLAGWRHKEQYLKRFGYE